MNQKLIATQIAQEIWSETGQMYRVGVSPTGIVEIMMPETNPQWELVKNAAMKVKGLDWEGKTLTLHFSFEETTK